MGDICRIEKSECLSCNSPFGSCGCALAVCAIMYDITKSYYVIWVLCDDPFIHIGIICRSACAVCICHCLGVAHNGKFICVCFAAVLNPRGLRPNIRMDSVIARTALILHKSSSVALSADDVFEHGGCACYIGIKCNTLDIASEIGFIMCAVRVYNSVTTHNDIMIGAYCRKSFVCEIDGTLESAADIALCSGICRIIFDSNLAPLIGRNHNILKEKSELNCAL